MSGATRILPIVVCLIALSGCKGGPAEVTGPGSGTLDLEMSAMVDGRAWSSERGSVGATPPVMCVQLDGEYGVYSLVTGIGDQDAHAQTSFTFVLQGPLALRTYSLGGAASEGTGLFETAASSWRTGSGAIGSVSITSIDRSRGRVAGTFGFVGASSADTQTVAITDGHFIAFWPP